MKSIEQIASELQGYDPNALSAEQVAAFLRQLAPGALDKAPQVLPVIEVLDRILAQDVVSPVSVPPHDNSAMDGYAFRGAELDLGQTVTLRCVGTALAGPAWQGQVGPGECVKIMTGAVMPTGLDTVVPQEMTQVAQERVTFPASALRTGDNRRLCG